MSSELNGELTSKLVQLGNLRIYTLVRTLSFNPGTNPKTRVFDLGPRKHGPRKHEHGLTGSCLGTAGAAIGSHRPAAGAAIGSQQPAAGAAIGSQQPAAGPPVSS